ncbi:galanin receptor type 2-like [Mizuhopecten yessoensis]|uniref:Galanin receptor type 2 n=1 Tax=Mizuhopecten yessoensis TaxID=6573 RepID=A0A210QL11_MIZYE|nr:galanin receptor type 2-like [Mizuhopecten yessoensis]XP_021355682.1 galanin receptor type 2-like [Mizuhopecten yessoensis]OWF49433.1 Galanin receptor type 2 [Mizuhopecten yessoensis]
MTTSDFGHLTVTFQPQNVTSQAVDGNLTEPEGELTADGIIVPVIWALLVITGTIGNGIVIYILSRYGERTVTNIYVINLAFSDLTFIVIVLPITAIHFVIPTYMFGEALCRISIYLIYVTLHATCLTLMAMTIDRYFAIVFPIQSMNWRNAPVATIVSVAVWIVSCLISLPYVLFTKLIEENDVSVCTQKWPIEGMAKGMALGVVITSYILPLGVILGCYGKILQYLWWGSKLKKTDHDSNGAPMSLKSKAQQNRKRRVTRMVLVVVLLFAACWLPIHVITLWMAFDPNFPLIDPLLIFKIFSHTLSYANSCVNPFVYAFLNDGFRKAFKRRFPSFSRWCSCLCRNTKECQETSMIDKAVEAKPGLEQSELLTTTQTLKRTCT